VFRCLGTGNQREAETKARLLVKAAEEKRWVALDESRMRRVGPNLGEIIAAYEKGIGARAKIEAGTVKRNVTVFRLFVREALRVEDGGVDASGCTVLTPKLIRDWQEGRVTAGVDKERAKNTANSTLRQAMSLFSRVALSLYADAGIEIPTAVKEAVKAPKLKARVNHTFTPLQPDQLATLDAEITWLRDVAPTHYLVLILQSFHLVTPAVPEIRKAVNHHHQRTFAHRCVVNTYAIAVGVTVCCAVPDIGVRCRDRHHRDPCSGCQRSTSFQNTHRCSLLLVG
jgi:hypothetical protein